MVTTTSRWWMDYLHKKDPDPAYTQPSAGCVRRTSGHVSDYPEHGKNAQRQRHGATSHWDRSGEWRWKWQIQRERHLMSELHHACCQKLIRLKFTQQVWSFGYHHSNLLCCCQTLCCHQNWPCPPPHYFWAIHHPYLRLWLFGSTRARLLVHCTRGWILSHGSCYNGKLQLIKSHDFLQGKIIPVRLKSYQGEGSREETRLNPSKA